MIVVILLLSVGDLIFGLNQVKSCSEYYRVSQKSASQGDVWFFNPKNVEIGSGIDKNKKSPSFLSIGQKMLILHENLEFLMPVENFPLKKGNFWPMGQKDGNFLFSSMPEKMVTF